MPFSIALEGLVQAKTNCLRPKQKSNYRDASLSIWMTYTYIVSTFLQWFLSEIWSLRCVMYMTIYMQKSYRHLKPHGLANLKFHSNPFLFHDDRLWWHSCQGLDGQSLSRFPSDHGPWRVWINNWWNRLHVNVNVSYSGCDDYPGHHLDHSMVHALAKCQPPGLIQYRIGFLVSVVGSLFMASLPTIHGQSKGGFWPFKALCRRSPIAHERGSNQH